PPNSSVEAEAVVPPQSSFSATPLGTGFPSSLTVPWISAAAAARGSARVIARAPTIVLVICVPPAESLTEVLRRGIPRGRGVPIDLEGRSGGLRPVELREPAAPGGDQSLPQAIVLVESRQCPGDLLVVARIDQHCRGSDDLGHGAQVRRDDRDSGLHRFDERKPEPLVEGRVK